MTNDSPLSLSQSLQTIQPRIDTVPTSPLSHSDQLSIQSHNKEPVIDAGEPNHSSISQYDTDKKERWELVTPRVRTDFNVLSLSEMLQDENEGLDFFTASNASPLSVWLGGGDELDFWTMKLGHDFEAPAKHEKLHSLFCVSCFLLLPMSMINNCRQSAQERILSNEPEFSS